VRYFLSGASGIRSHLVPDVAAFIPYRLLSMHKAFKGNTKVWCEVSHHAKSGLKEVMLDSGAFTAFTKGHKVSLDELTAAYDDTLAKLNPKLDVWLINLDVIPGEYGRVATPAEIRDALDASDTNYKKLRKRYGDRVLPVFHQTEAHARLVEVVSQNWFVAAGFRQDFSEEHRIRCAEEVLHYAHSKGVIVHGLATTGYKMLRRAPFDTVDSASWLYTAAMGGIHFVDQAGDLADIPVSQESPLQRDARGHYRTVTVEEQAWIEKQVQAAGATIAQVESDLSYRILVNAHQMAEWLKSYKAPKADPVKGLFDL
jgi:hypothetical protein